MALRESKKLLKIQWVTKFFINNVNIDFPNIIESKKIRMTPDSIRLVMSLIQIQLTTQTVTNNIISSMWKLLMI